MVKAKVCHGEAHDVQKRPLKSLWLKLVISLAVTVVILLTVLQLLTLDGPNSRRAWYEASAVRKLQRIVILQKDYAASHPAEGFACRLMLLKPTAPTKDEYDRDTFLSSESPGVYRITLTGGDAESNGVVKSYRITAVPLETEKSGVRTFCSDQTGAIWYDVGGSAESCLLFHRALK